VEPALAKILKIAKDAFLVESAVEGLGKIGGDAAGTGVPDWTRHSSLRVRVKAREVLLHIEAKKIAQACC
jgi:hypothetical protein